MTLSEIQKAIGSVQKLQDDFRIRKPERVETLAQAAYIEAAKKEAAETLIKQGLKADVVEAMPSFQVVSLFAYREYRNTREEVLKWVNVPEGNKHPAFRDAVKRHERAADRMDQMFFRGLIRGLGNSSFERIFNAASRLDRHVAALRCVEAAAAVRCSSRPLADEAGRHQGRAGADRSANPQVVRLHAARQQSRGRRHAAGDR